MACQLGGSKAKCVGYCRYHKCNITAKQMKRRKCLKKQCGALARLPHPYWESREAKRKLRKAHKTVHTI